MKMSFLGDVFLDKEYQVDIELENFIFNLEYPLSTSGTPAKDKINLGADIPHIKETFGSLPKAVNLANNHIMDYGEEAFKKTIEYFDKENIKYFGVGNKKNNYNNPCILNFDKKSIALFGYSCSSTHAVFGNENNNGSALLDIDEIVKDIKSCREKVDMIVITLHWGDEEIKYPKYTDILLAHIIIDAGADLIVGHHAHVIQSIEKYNDKYIFYGIGNFIFPDFNAPSYYNGKEFTRRSSKINQKENKQSIIININEDLHVTYETATFEKGIVKKSQVVIPTWLPDTEFQYTLCVQYLRRLGTLKRFLKNPKIPTMKQFKIFLGFR